MPHEIQEEMVHSLKGLEHAKILKYAYAIEYDAIDPLEMKKNLENKIIENLFTAGQINGTSGYEEAAAQGLMAGINAVLKIENKEPFILGRDEAYIGVLIDDLTTKGTKEPYRMLTSRAEYRLLLRHDNADIRLKKYGYGLGLISESRYKKYQDKIKNIQELKDYLKTNKIVTSENELLKCIGTSTINDGITLYDLLKRPEITISKLNEIGKIKEKYTKDVIEQVEIDIKYAGYIEKEKKEIEKMKQLEEIKIPENIDYDKVINIANEAKEKLKKVLPISLGQASRISGVNPSDITMLAIYLKKEKKNG
jgi:tRNA uridine 5-carboxymethylaminomethyl modification enzyme